MCVDAAAQRHRDARAAAGRHPGRAGPAREAVDSHPGARRWPLTGATTVYPCCHPHDTAMHLRNMDIIPTGPVPGSQRLELLDALRGFALAGVLVANLEAFSLYYFLSPAGAVAPPRSEEHTSELQSLMRISYAVVCLKTKTTTNSV